ncbi:MAG: aminotransferase [Pseudomonadota bacterium]
MTFQLNRHVAAVSEPPTGETARWIKEGLANPDLPLIDAAQAVPNYPPAEVLREHLAEVVRQAESAFYTPILGLPKLRDALALDLAKGYDAPIGEESVAITCGGNHAFCMAILALASPGDEVILPEPFYFNHEMWFDMQGIGVRRLACRERGEGMVPEPADAAALITERTRAIVLISPNNPTGTIYEPARLKAFYDLARQHDLALVVDETYKDFLPGDGPAHSLFAEPDWGDVFVQLYSFSKVYSLTGYRTGSIAAGPRFIQAVAKIADTLNICAPRVGQEAALFGLTELGDWREHKRQDLLARIKLLDRAVAKHKPAFQMVSRGAFFAYLRHPLGGQASIEVSRRLLMEQSVLTWPGSFFGRDQDPYIRLAFANAKPTEIDETIARLARFGDPA